MDTLLIEIGAEEIPAGYIEPALDAFSSLMKKKLTDARIGFGAVSVYGTPRRLAVMVAEVHDRQTPMTTEVTGPPESAGFDAQGNPTVAARKFAEKAGIPVTAVRIVQTPKGRYLCADKIETALPTPHILSEALPSIIQAIPFPKTMKWAALSVTFARPVHWIVALYGDTVIPFTFGNIPSGKISCGHRFMSPGPVEISSPSAYVDRLRQARVIVDLAERRSLVQQEVARIARELRGNVLPDEELVDTVKNIVEYPCAVAGRFEERFLEVPDEVLITAMREHQKYFSVVDDAGRLMPCFIPVNNTLAKDPSVVATGHERVIRARLSDAQFFFKSDAAARMDQWTEKLKKVLFQAKLGSMYEKVVRVKALAEYVADQVAPGSDLATRAARAAWLCKADLVSHVVVEFTKLQGVMGRNYARMAGEPEETALAIEEHYRPTHSGGPLPSTRTGAVVAVADKIDAICGCFSVGLLPTGASDPYALRRQGIGILQIMYAHGFCFSLKSLIEKSVSLFEDKREKDAKDTVEAVYDFLKNRMAHILEDEGYEKDVVSAVADVSVDHVPRVWTRVKALQHLKTRPDFDSLAVAFKRVVNIIRKSDRTATEKPDAVDEGLFTDPCEQRLLDAYHTVNDRVSALLKEGDFERALTEVAALREPVDGFFDGVMVLADDLRLRANRLGLLTRIATLFARFADFSKISA